MTASNTVVRLAELGAAQQQRLDAVAARAEKRLMAWHARDRAGAGRLPTADELETAVAAGRMDADEEDE